MTERSFSLARATLALPEEEEEKVGRTTFGREKEKERDGSARVGSEGDEGFLVFVEVGDVDEREEEREAATIDADRRVLELRCPLMASRRDAAELTALE